LYCQRDQEDRQKSPIRGILVASVSAVGCDALI